MVDVAGESVLVTRSPDGALAAFYNVCRHRGSQIVPADPASPAPEPCAVGALRCPYHSWTYDLSGGLLRAPHTEGVEDFDAGGLRAAPRRGGHLGRLPLAAPHPRGRATARGGARRRARPRGALPARSRSWSAATLTYDVHANYKVLLENYNECYHCAGVHPELVRLVPAFGRGGAGLDWEGGIPHRDGAWTFTATGTSAARPVRRPRRRRAGAAQGRAALSQPDAEPVGRPRRGVHPVAGCPPVAPASCATCSSTRTRRRRDGFDPSDAADFWDVVNRQDWAVCESVQRGMSSRAFTQGWFAPMEDAALDIRRWLLPRLEQA